MGISGELNVFLLGCAGGVLAEVMHWWGLRREDKLPRYLTSAFYWIVTGIMVVCGGLVCWIYFGARAEGLVALHIGVSTPLILQKLATSIPETGGSKGALLTPQRSVHDFFRW
jgi:hypothetical protein